DFELVVREGNRSKQDGEALLAEGLAGVAPAALHRVADIPRDEVRPVLPLLARDVEELPNLLRALGARVPDFLPGNERAGEDTDHGEVPRVGLAARLEDERCQVPVGLNRKLDLLLGARLHAGHGTAIDGAGQ